MSAAPRTSVFAALTADCEQVVVPGSDPELVAALLAWAVRPRRSLEAVRRVLAANPGPGTTAERLRAHVLPGIDADDAGHARQLVVDWVEKRCRVSVVGDPGYPPRLASGWPDTDGPVLLACAGAMPPDRPTVAMVGSRRASSYGSGVAAWLARAAGEAGAHVVSGGAVGIDAAAHRAALSTEGGTSVVLGCGHAVAYPQAHARPGGLFPQVLAEGGGLLSEQLPRVAPKAGIVRARNRIVAALADVVVVVEGGPRSGALLTATAASELSRPVLAVPGDIRVSGSAAPNRLLGEGAQACSSPDDLLAALPAAALAAARFPDGTDPGRAEADASGVGGAAPISSLPVPLYQALAAAWPRALPVDSVLERTGLGTGEVLSALTRAQVHGEVAEGPDGVVLRRPPVDAHNRP